MRFTTTTVKDKDLISVLLATRARPQNLARFLDSLEATTERFDQVDVWLYVDADDALTHAFLDQVAATRYSFKIQVVEGMQVATNGEMYNRLREQNTSGPGIYMFVNDKIVMLTQGWDRITREAFDLLPDRILFAYPNDNVHKGTFGAFGFLSAEWANVNGRLMTGYFPFWFDDTWYNHVAATIGRIMKLDIELHLEAGPTARMQNLLFWDRFYQALLPERNEEARQLQRYIRRRGGEATYQFSLAHAPDAMAKLRKHARLRPEEDKIRNTERHQSVVLQSRQPRSLPGSLYRRAEDAAVAHLLELLVPLAHGGIPEEVEAAFEALLYSGQAAEDLIRRAREAIEEDQAGPDNPFLVLLMQRFQNFPEPYLLCAEACLNLGRRSEAEAVLKQSRLIFPGYPEFSKRLGLVAFEAGELARAEACFLEALALDEQDPDSLLSLGQVALAAGQPAAARAWFARAADVAPAEVEAQLGLALAAQALGDEAEREAALGRALAIAPHHPALAGLTQGQEAIP